MVVALLVLSLASTAFSQAVTGSISGTVKDSTGAVLPGAQVVLLNQDTGFTRTVQSDAAGRYVATSLPLGDYQVTATLQGFQTMVRSGIVLTVAREAVVDLELSVGAVTQTVEVFGEAALIDTTSATVSGLVDQEQIRDLPLNGRSLTDLTLLNPGVFYNRTTGNSPSDGMGPRLSINGGRQESNLYLIDGINATDRTGGAATSSGATLGVEAIREFRVLTHNFSVEYGRNSGGVVSLVTRSGTNQFHGSLYEFVRNNILDARDFYNRGGQGKPPFRRNQFGAAAGGPVVRDRIHFFANYEGLRQRLAQSYVTSVPDANARKGLLPDPARPGQLRQVNVSPLIAPYLNDLTLWPLPNDRLFGDGTGQYIVDQSLPLTENFGMGRMDFRLGDNDNFYLRYISNPSERFRARPMPNFMMTDMATNHFATLSETHIFSGTALNEFRFGFNRTQRGSDSIPLIDYDPSLDFNPGQGFGQIRFNENVLQLGQLTPLGNSGLRANDTALNLFQATDTFTLIRGAHSLKFGVNLERTQENTNSLSGTRGEFFFNNLEELLQARPYQLEGTVLDPSKSRARGMRQTLFGWFVHDDWRVRQNLTINLGFRHEFLTDPTEVNGNSGNLRNITDPAPTLGPAMNLSKRNIAPRVGLAWDPTGNGRTSVRLGAGVYHNQIAPRESTNSDPYAALSYVVANPPTYPRLPANPSPSARSETTSQWPMDTPTVIHYSLDVQRQLTSTLSARLGYVGSYGYNMTRSTQQNIRIPRILADGTKFWENSFPRPNPNYSNIVQRRADTVSNYNALQATVQQALRSGLMFGASYTWGKGLSEADGVANRTVDNGGSFVSLDKDDPGMDYGRSSYDQRHAFVLNSQYRMPWDRYLTGGVAKTLFGGWAINGIWQYGSGMPLNVQTAFNNSRSGQGSAADRPNVLPGASNNPTSGATVGCGGVIPGGEKLRTPDRWFDPCAFGLPPAGSWGNAGRNTIDGPNWNQVSFTILKNTALGESRNLEFRAEFFNLFNHPSFGLTNIQIFSSSRQYAGNAATISTTASQSRQMQLGMKFTF